MEEPPQKSDLIKVKTTLPAMPLPASADRTVVKTKRLLIRPLHASDIDAYYSMRTQPEVMYYTLSGRIDASKEESQQRLNNYLPPNDVRSHNCAICLLDTGEFIGAGGVHQLGSIYGWPEVGYQLRKEYWGAGLATEFLQAFLIMWKSLPRVETELLVDPRTVTGDDGSSEEQIIAIIEDSNIGSGRVLTKNGFENFLTVKDKNSHENPESEYVDLPIFRYYPGRAS
jgi:RimJ/RimL family protein N-acetyltransferase